jgi:hypothetical protein
MIEWEGMNCWMIEWLDWLVEWVSEWMNNEWQFKDNEWKAQAPTQSASSSPAYCTSSLSHLFFWEQHLFELPLFPDVFSRSRLFTEFRLLWAASSLSCCVCALPLLLPRPRRT